MSAAVVITPWAPSHAIELAARQWIKRILPIGDVRYQGRVLRFTKPYLQGLADAFKQKAYDQVPVQAADRDNSHTNAIERFRGEVLDMEVRHDGLYALVKPTDEGERLLQMNPDVGVSARIIEGYDRADGKYFPAALQHVLLTLDPRVPGLGSWSPAEPVSEMSNDGPVPVLDLSNGYYFEGNRYTVDLAAENAALAEAVNEADSDEEIAALLGMTPEEFQALNGSDDDDSDFTPEELAELDALAAGDDELAESVREQQAASLSNTYDYPGGGEMELAGDWSGQIDLAMQMAQQRAEQAVSRDRVRVAEQAQMRGWQAEAGYRQPGTEHKLEYLYQRVAKGTYLPAPGFEFGSYGQRDITLSQLRRSQDVIELAGADVAAATGACGVLDAFGRCGEPNHSASCSAIYSPDHLASEEGRRLLAEAAVTPIGDGRQMLPGDWLEAQTGVRLSHEDSGPFETQRAERAGYTFQRRPVYGDPQEGGGTPLDDAATQLRVSQLRDAMGITAPERASRVARQQAVTDRRAAMKLQTPMQRAGLDTSHLETMQERAGRARAGSIVPLEIDGMVVGYTKATV